MPLYNVAGSVVDLIHAESPEQAMQTLRTRLSAAGFDPHEEGWNAFESEPIDNGLENDLRLIRKYNDDERV